jgi:hypothetical protein
MNAALWTGVVGYAVLACGLGALLLRACRLEPDPLVEGWGHAYLAGQLVLTALTLLTAWLPVDLAVLRAVTVGAAAAGWTWTARRPEGRRAAGALLGGMLAWGAAAVALFPVDALIVHATPVAGWDARSIWFFHGKAIHAAGRLTMAFFADPLYAWSHLDYPLFLPAQAAWSVRGAWDEYACRAFLWFDLAAVLHLLMHAWRAQGFRLLPALAAALWIMDRAGRGMIDGYADHHYAACLAIGLLILLGGAGRSARPAGLTLLGCAAALKQEGALYAVLLAAALGGAWSVRRFRGIERNPVRAGMAVWLLIAAAPFLLWLFFRAETAVRPEDAALWPSAAGVAEWPGRLAGRGGGILRGMLLIHREAGTVWRLAVIGAAWAARALLARRTARCIRGAWRDGAFVMAWLGVHVIVFATFLNTPFEIGWHVGTAGERLLVPAHWTLNLLAVLALAPLVRAAQNAAGHAVNGEGNTDHA